MMMYNMNSAACNNHMGEFIVSPEREKKTFYSRYKKHYKSDKETLNKENDSST